MTFNINICSIKESYFWFLGLSGVTMVTSLSGSTRDFLKLPFHMFLIMKFQKFSKVKFELIFEKKHLKIPLNTKFQRNQSGGLGVTSI